MANVSSCFSFLENAALEFSSKSAIIDGPQQTDFSDLFQQSLSIKEHLLKVGVQPGMVVGILFPNGGVFVSALFAVLGCDATVLPVYPSLKAAERRQLIETSEMNYLLVNRSNLLEEHHIYKVAAEWKDFVLLGIRTQVGLLLQHIRHPACIRFSSGTTGLHKGVVLSHQAVRERTEEVIKVLELKSDDRVLWVLPMAFHYIATIMAFVRYGITLVVCNAMFAREIISTANQSEATVLYASPMHLRLLASEGGHEGFKTMKQVVTTSSGIDQLTCERFAARFGLIPRQAYGIIEVGLPLVNKSDDLERASELGKPGGNYGVGILDESGRELGTDVEGKLAIRGPGMFDGYMAPAVNREDVLRNGWFLTGDTALRKADGMIVLKGREKAMINVSGNKVFPEEVEAVLEHLKGIAEALVFSMIHPLTGEYVAAKVVLTPEAKLTESQILQEVRSQLTAYKVPRKILFASAIEKTATGKKKRTGPVREQF